MRRRKKFFIVIRIFVILFLCAIIASVVAISKLNIDSVKNTVVNAIESAMGAPVEIGGDVNLRLSLRPKIAINKVRVHNSDWAKHKYAFEADNITVTLNLLSVFNKNLMIEKVVVNTPVVYIEKNNKGEYSLPVLNPKEQTTTDTTVVKKQEKYVFKDLGLGGVELYNVNVNFVDTHFKLKGVGFKYYNKNTGPEYEGWIKLTNKITPFVLSFGAYDKEYNLYPVQLAISTQGRALIGNFNLDGNTKNLVDFTIKGDVPDNEILKFISGNNKINLPKINLDVTGKLDNTKISFDKLNINALHNDISISGVYDWKTNGIKLNIKSNKLNLLALYPDLYGSQEIVGRELNVFQDMYLFGKEVRQYNINVTANIKHLVVYRDIDIQNINTKITLNAGNGRVDTKVKFANGDINIGADVNIDNDGKMFIRAGIDGQSIDLGQLMTELRYKDMVSDLNLNLLGYFDASGANMSEVMQTITGAVKAYSITEGYAHESLVEYMYGADVLTTLHHGVSDMLTKEKKYNTITINNVGINLKLRNGLIETERGVAIETEIINLRMAGNVDLGRETIDLTLVTTPVSGLKISLTGAITNAVRISGNLAEPDISISGTAIAGRVATATGFGLLMAPFTGGLSILGGWLASDFIGNWLTDNNPAETALKDGTSILKDDPEWLEMPLEELVNSVVIR